MSDGQRKSAKHEFLSELQFDLSDLDSVDLFGDRARLNHDPDLFLGLFTADEIKLAALESGITPGLQKKGFINWEIVLSTESSGDHRLIIEDPETGENLVFMRLHVGSFSADKIPVNMNNLRLLFIDWLLLQNPSLPVRPGKLFPGQKFPGNGLFPEVKKFMVFLIKKAKLDGAANLPEFFHDAVLFADKFKFLHPRSQGIFEAILRDLGKKGLRNLSNMIHSGQVRMREKGKDEITFEFRPGEMVVPNSPELQMYFESTEYRSQAKKTLEKVSFLRILQDDA